MVICSIVVLYNPDIQQLNGLLSELYKQVDHIVFVDNTPDDMKNYNDAAFQCEKLIYINLGDNLGIAKAHNVGIKKALELSSDYFIIFDQDSSISEDLVSSLVDLSEKLKNKGEKVGAVGPAYLDIKTNIIAPAIQFKGLKVRRININEAEEYTVADYIISSGTLISSLVIKEIGLMKDELFIDYVDVEWGLRAKQLGYNCYIANQVLMRHSIGDVSIKVPFINKSVNIHSDFRKYFILRNGFFLIIHSDLPWNWRLVQIPKTMMYFFFLLIFISSRLKLLKIFFIALRDALLKKMYKGSM